MSATLDQRLLNTTKINSLNFFHASADGEMMIKTGFDMMLTVDQFKNLHSSRRKEDSKRNALRDEYVYRWPDDTVKYDISSLVYRYLFDIRNAIRWWENYTCIRFSRIFGGRFRTNYVRFTAGRACASLLGMKRDSRQDITLTEDCMSVITPAHEIAHALGFVHEHSRYDRDKYLGIDYMYINKAVRSNFDIFSEEVIDTHGIEYDYRSIMHYGGLGVMFTLDPDYQDIIGNVVTMSFRDIKLANIVYDCAAKMGCPEKSCPFEGFVWYGETSDVPRCQCWCDSGDLRNRNPIIPCSSVRRSPRRYNLRARSSSGETNETTCLDLNLNCHTLKEQGLCQTETRNMLRFCAKTCNFCGKDHDICMDYEEACTMMAETGACKEGGLTEFMSKVCPKSCGLCSVVFTECDIQNVLQGNVKFQPPGNTAVSVSVPDNTLLPLSAIFFMLSASVINFFHQILNSIIYCLIARAVTAKFTRA